MARPGVVVRLLIMPIHTWQVGSRLVPPRCRFYPSCSQYAVDALTTHGAVRGLGLAARRLGRCHPWHPGGIDFVPPNIRSSGGLTMTVDSRLRP